MCRTAHAVLSVLICGVQMLVRVFMIFILMLENVIRLIMQTLYNFISFLLQMASLLPICLVFLLTTRLKCFMCGGGGPCPVNRGGGCDCLMSLAAVVLLFFIFRAVGLMDKVFYKIGYVQVPQPVDKPFSPTPGDVRECSREGDVKITTNKLRLTGFTDNENILTTDETIGTSTTVTTESDDEDDDTDTDEETETFKIFYVMLHPNVTNKIKIYSKVTETKTNFSNVTKVDTYYSNDTETEIYYLNVTETEILETTAQTTATAETKKKKKKKKKNKKSQTNLKFKFRKGFSIANDCNSTRLLPVVEKDASDNPTLTTIILMNVETDSTEINGILNTFTDVSNESLTFFYRRIPTRDFKNIPTHFIEIPDATYSNVQITNTEIATAENDDLLFATEIYFKDVETDKDVETNFQQLDEPMPALTTSRVKVRRELRRKEKNNLAKTSTFAVSQNEMKIITGTETVTSILNKKGFQTFLDILGYITNASS